MADSNLFYQLSLGFGIHYMTSLKEEEKTQLQNRAIAKGNYIFFDNSFFGNRNAENYEDEIQKITFEVTESALYNIPILDMCKEFIDKNMANDARGLLSSKKYLNPLEPVIIVPVVDMKFSFIEMKKGGLYVMPACMAYIIFKEDTETAIRIFANLVINIALCFVGVGAIRAAISAGSALGIFAGVTDVTLGVLCSTVNTIPEIERNHPDFVKFVNYATLIYGLGRLGYAAYCSLKINKMSKAEIEDALRSTLSKEEAEMEKKVSDFMSKWEGKKVSGKGFAGSPKLSRAEIQEWRDFLSETFGVTLKFAEKDKEVLRYFEIHGGHAGFDAETNTIWIKKEEVTNFVMTHEMLHAQECSRLGKEAYLKGSRLAGGSRADDLIRTYKREKYVYDELMKKSYTLTQAEIRFSQDYIDSILKALDKAGIDVEKIIL